MDANGPTRLVSAAEAALAPRSPSSAAWLELVRTALLDDEDSLFGVLPVLGEPTTQAAVDGWVDQAVDLLRALGEEAVELAGRAALLGPGPQDA